MCLVDAFLIWFSSEEVLSEYTGEGLQPLLNTGSAEFVSCLHGYGLTESVSHIQAVSSPVFPGESQCGTGGILVREGGEFI